MLPPADAPLEEEYEKVYTELGRAITKWQSVEAELARTFTSATAGGNYASNVAFHTILSFDSKLTMTTAVITFVYRDDPQLHEEWNNLRNRLARRNDKRNRLAHFAISCSSENSSGHRVHLRPNVADMRAAFRWKGEPPKIFQSDLVTIGMSFDEVASALKHFRERWFGDKTAQIRQKNSMRKAVHELRAFSDPHR